MGLSQAQELKGPADRDDREATQNKEGHDEQKEEIGGSAFQSRLPRGHSLSNLGHRLPIHLVGWQPHQSLT